MGVNTPAGYMYKVNFVSYVVPYMHIRTVDKLTEFRTFL